MRWRTVAAFALALSPALPLPAGAQARELHWRALDVSAQLSADGRLRVLERHAMVFTGDWNGGERMFDLGQGESLQVHRLSRVGAGGERVALRERRPPGVDEYAWGESNVLRWRSRAATDPPFRGREIVYELEYTIAGVLRPHEGLYRLDYDFGVPQRPGPVERLTLDLQVDPDLQPTQPVALRRNVARLPPGAGHRVVVDFRLQGAALEAALATERRTRLLTGGVFALLVLAILVRLGRFWRGERASGRLEPLTPESRIDEAWLAEHLLGLPAEVVGAVWDRSIGAPEVAATLARLEAEGKIETWANRTDPSVRHLRLLVPATALRGHERLLLDALLLGGTETDTDAVKRWYKAAGFDPAAVIAKPLDGDVRALLGPDRARRGLPGTLIGILLLAAVAALVRAVVADGDPRPLLAAAALLPFFLAGMVFAHLWRVRVGGRWLAASGYVVPVALLVAGVAVAAAWGVVADPLALAGLAAIALLLAEGILSMAATRESPAAMRIRKRLTAAERALRRALRAGSEAVKPEWFPHLLALGLADDANRWSAAQSAGGGGSSPTTWSGGGDRGSATSGTSSPGFSAGGGSFGGAGASGSWGAAAMAFSSSVAAPSSSGSGGSSSSGSSSSSSSSGGGGAGGW